MSIQTCMERLKSVRKFHPVMVVAIVLVAAHVATTAVTVAIHHHAAIIAAHYLPILAVVTVTLH